jgi:hypothetical protein
MNECVYVCMCVCVLQLFSNWTMALGSSSAGSTSMLDKSCRSRWATSSLLAECCICWTGGTHGVCVHVHVHVHVCDYDGLLSIGYKCIHVLYESD